jgi:ParB family transcriptional regulator, chromosome partitioning protein
MRHDWHYVEELSQSQRTVGRIIPLDKIEPNPDQPRSEIGDLTDLAASIKEKGVLEPLLVKPLEHGQSWLIIAGERRWRAARLAGLAEVPCVELDVDEKQIAEIALIENLQRKDLTVWEEADGLKALGDRFGYTHEDIAKRIGKSRSTVTESLTIASLPPSIREKCAEAKINSKSAILQIARQFDEETMLEAIKNLTTPPVPQPNDEQHEESAKIKGLPLNNGKTGANDKKEEMTNLSSPVRSYSYRPPKGDFKLALKFKKPVDREGIINVLKMIIEDLRLDK